MTSDSSAAAASSAAGGVAGTSYSNRSSVPWSQVVRGGGEPEQTPVVDSRSLAASPSSVVREQTISDQVTVTEPQTAATVESNLEGSEGSNVDNESGVKKSAWSKPSANGVVEGSSTPVMGAASWPALSELTRPLPKSLSFQSESSPKSTSDGSATVSQAPVVSQVQQRPGKTNASHHSNQNHTHAGRQRSMKRGGGAGGGYNRIAPPPPPPMPPYPLFNTPYGGFVPAVLDAPVREQAPYNGSSFVPTRPVAGVGPHAHPVHDHPFNRKRNNFGPRPRGDGGPYVNNGPGGRRDHNDREWFGLRSHGGVIPHHGVPPPPPPPRGYMQQAHLGPAPFIAPQPIRPYGAPMVYDMPPPPPFVYMPPPIIPHATPSTNIPSLSDMILRQIEYYFSDANLVKDHYLRSNMDEEGWVPITLIAGFHRVKSLTSDLQMVLSSIRDSTIVEVQGETLRRRNDWRKWIKPSINLPSDSSSQSPKATTDCSIIETSLQKFSLDESTTDEKRTTDTELSGSIKPDNGEVTSGDESQNPKSSTS